MFKTARFRIHNPSRDKVTMLRYAMENYHRTLKCVLEAALADPDLSGKISRADSKGRQRVNKREASRLLYTLAPRGWGLAPLRDYLIGDATAMLLSHFKKLEKGRNESRPPVLADTHPASPEEIATATEVFARSIEFPVKPQQAERIAAEARAGRPRVAARLANIYRSWAATRAAGELLRTLEGAPPRPIEFTRPEFGRGFLLARRGNKYYLLVRLFAKGHRYRKELVLAPDFVNCRTGEPIGGRTYPGLVLPLEFSREYHANEYLRHGRAQSAKLVMKRTGGGREEFYAHIAFEFQPKPIATERFLGIDRGAAMIGAATIVDASGKPLPVSLDLEGAAFSQEMNCFRRLIAEAQRKGHRKKRLFRVRGRRADILIGEYATGSFAPPSNTARRSCWKR